MQKKGFTLLEMIIVMTGFFLLLAVVMQMYMSIVKSKHGVQARQDLLQTSYYTLERLNVELKNYQIDYEEYFNRKMVGCDQSEIENNFVRDTNSGHTNAYCDNFTYYGNQNSIRARTENQHKLYACSSNTGYLWPDELVIQSAILAQGSGCRNAGFFDPPYFQAYGQYAKHFFDVKNNVDTVPSAIQDNDDLDLGMGPIAIADAEHIQELYLISPDGTQRVFLRRALVETGDRDQNQNGIISGSDESRYSIQILKLKGFDAGENHDFDINNPGVYDGQIDTWACDFTQGFICHGTPVDTNLYSGYNLPISVDDGRVDLVGGDLTLTDRQLKIYPDSNRDLARTEDAAQINPYIQISITHKLFGKTWKRRLGAESLSDFQVTLQTLFNTRGYY